jgi:S-adenosylmethionine hydrolase
VLRPTIAIITDFGIRDWYLAAMKGVVASLNSDVLFIDITHDIRPHSILEAAFVLGSCCAYFPGRTVFLAVVDPGVGTQRRPIAVDAGGRFFVGPDNGIFGPVIEADPGFRCVEVEPEIPPESSTFHGRDVFAPAAAKLSLGTPFEKLGKSVLDPVRLAIPKPERIDRAQLKGQVLYADRFGNLVTNVRSDLVASPDGKPAVSLLSFPGKGVSIARVCRTYAELGRREPGILVGSAGFIEVAMFGASAAAFFGIGAGEPLELTIAEKAPDPRRKA